MLRGCWLNVGSLLTSLLQLKKNDVLCLQLASAAPGGQIFYSKFKNILDYTKQEDKSLEINTPFGLSVHVQFMFLRTYLCFCI